MSSNSPKRGKKFLPAIFSWFLAFGLHGCAPTPPSDPNNIGEAANIEEAANIADNDKGGEADDSVAKRAEAAANRAVEAAKRAEEAAGKIADSEEADKVEDSQEADKVENSQEAGRESSKAQADVEALEQAAESLRNADTQNLNKAYWGMLDTINSVTTPQAMAKIKELNLASLAVEKYTNRPSGATNSQQTNIADEVNRAIEEAEARVAPLSEDEINEAAQALEGNDKEEAQEH